MRLPTLRKRERRRAKRRWFNGSIQVWNGVDRIDGLGIQLSTRGMYLFAIADLPVGAEIKVVFTPPESTGRVELYAAVRHRTVYLYGIEFVGGEERGVTNATRLDEASIASP